MNTLSPVNGNVWEGFGNVALLEEVCHWEQALKFQKTSTIPSMHLCFLLLDQDMNSRLFLCSAIMGCNPPKLNEMHPVINCLGYGVLSQQ